MSLLKAVSQEGYLQKKLGLLLLQHLEVFSCSVTAQHSAVERQSIMHDRLLCRCPDRCQGRGTQVATAFVIGYLLAFQYFLLMILYSEMQLEKSLMPPDRFLILQLYYQQFRRGSKFYNQEQPTRGIQTGILLCLNNVLEK